MRLLLDSNIWRYLVDEGSIGEIVSAVRRGRGSILIAPSVLFEAAHTRDRALRHRLLAAMTSPTWKRLMPEAYSQAEELKGEIKRLRPEWLRPVPDFTVARRAKRDWLRRHGGLWEKIARQAALLQAHDAGMLARARSQAHRLRDDAKSWPAQWETANLTKTVGMLQEPRAGWNGEPVEPWRFDAMNVFATAINTPAHPALDWLGGEIDLWAMESQAASSVRFWLHEVEVVHMPRHWLQWAFQFLQRMRRVTDGTPGDAQLGMYLVEADLVLSADKTFIWIAQRCRRDAPFRVADAALVSGAERIAPQVLARLT